MKKFAFLLLAAIFVTACSNDADLEDQIQLDKAPLVEADLSKMLPDASFDNSIRGTYSGVVVADDTNFHGRLYLNIQNRDDRAEASIITIEGDRLSFKGSKVGENLYSFEGSRGIFDVDLSDITLVNINNLQIDGKLGEARVRKELKGAKNALVLGTFDDELSVAFMLPLSYTGTWDFIVDAGTAPFISETVFVTAGGNMKSDFAADMETADAGCVYGVTAPFFLEDAMTGEYEIKSVGQIVPLAGGRTLGYDYVFSKFILDANGLTDYTLGAGFMPLMNNLIFSGGLTGCNTFSSHGFYLMDDGVAFVAGGAITFDTSVVPPPPPPSFGPVEGDKPIVTPATFSSVLGDF